MSRDGEQRLTTASDAAALHQRLSVSLRRRRHKSHIRQRARRTTL